jgi:hypothetical protein
MKLEACAVGLSRIDRQILEARGRAPSTSQQDLKRAQIVLLAGDGWGTRAIANEVDVMPRAASLRRNRYADEGLAGLVGRKHEGRKPIHTAAAGKRILALLDKPAPQGFARWSGPLLAKGLGDIDVQSVWRFLRDHRIDLKARKSWCESTDPDFAAKAADLVGLYLAPPAKAVVLCIDEKHLIPALERAQDYLKMPKGCALTGQSHDYVRHGTTTLFAALDVSTGKIAAAHAKRGRRLEFLAFMDRLVKAYPGRQWHVVLDNLNIHEKKETWLARHPNVKFHDTPTHASWLNPIENWFSILQGQSLSGASGTALSQLLDHIHAFVEKYNQTAKPFAWTKKEVRQKKH